MRYSVSLNVYALPLQAIATTLGYTIPSGATWSFPTGVAKTPQLTFNTSFVALIGQLAGTYPSTVWAVNTQYLSSITPTISPINSYILTCNLVNSPFSIPSNVFYTLPLSRSLGNLFSANISEIVYNDIATNIYSQITIQFFDQLFNKLYLYDLELVLTLSIKLAKKIIKYFQYI